MGYEGPVVSPTYTILEAYDGRLPIYHFDFYRIAAPEELRSLDPREYFDRGISFIEWPERVESLWPATRREVRLDYEGTRRRLTERTEKVASA